MIQREASARLCVKVIVDEIVRTLQPKRVFDAGCGTGLLLEALWDRGVETRGRDTSQTVLDEVRPDLKDFVQKASVVEPNRKNDTIS